MFHVMKEGDLIDRIWTPPIPPLLKRKMKNAS